MLCDQEVRRIWSWAIKRDIFIIVDVEADQESRKSELGTERKLHESIFGYIQKYLDFCPSVALVASKINAQLAKFFTYRWDPKAEMINTFCVSWQNL